MSETKHGYANFKRAELLKLLKPFLGRIKNTPVEKIAVDKDGALHIYGINYLNYQR